MLIKIYNVFWPCCAVRCNKWSVNCTVKFSSKYERCYHFPLSESLQCSCMPIVICMSIKNWSIFSSQLQQIIYKERSLSPHIIPCNNNNKKSRQKRHSKNYIGKGVSSNLFGALIWSSCISFGETWNEIFSLCKNKIQQKDKVW